MTENGPCSGPGCQRWQNKTATYRDVRIDRTVRRGDYQVEELVGAEQAQARTYIEAHHYSGSWPAVSRCYAYRDADDGHLAGVAVLGIPMRRTVLTNAFALEPYVESLELSRFVCGPEVPANGETNFLAGISRLAAEAGIRGLVSFADPIPRTDAAGRLVKLGHFGIIYQAYNARYCGTSTPRTQILLPDGQVFSHRTEMKVRHRERGWRYGVDQLVGLGARPPRPREDLAGWLTEALDQIGARRFRHPGAHRYLIPIGRDRRERAAVKLLMAAQSYPKPARP